MKDSWVQKKPGKKAAAYEMHAHSCGKAEIKTGKTLS